MKKHSFNIYSRYLIPIIIVVLLLSCDDDIIPPTPEPPTYDSTLYTEVLKGKVILENQTEHSNALVYLDSLNRGVGTDSSGNYSMQFSDEDSIYNGTFKILFFVNEFEMDSAQYVLVNGKVKLDSLDVDSVGNLPTKELKQLLLIEGWTDKHEYRIACDPVTADCDIDIYPQGFYDGTGAFTIRDSNYCIVNVEPLLPDQYIVVADLFIEDRLLNFWTNKMDNFIGKEWDKLHRGWTPKLDWYPNKYKYPIIRIIE